MTNTVPAPLRANKLPLGYDGRRGRAFSVRLDDVERNRLAELHAQARPEMPWRPHRTNSLGAFIVWAAMQWKPGQQKLQLGGGELVDGAGRVVGRRVLPTKPKRRSPGTTRRPGRRRRPTGKKGRRS